MLLVRARLIIYFTFFTLFLLKAQDPFFKTHPFSETNKKTIVNTILEAKDGFLWFGTSNGLSRYNGLEFKPIVSIDSVLVSNVTALFEDEQATIWMGTKEGNIFYLEKNKPLQKWMPEEGTPAKMITGISKTNDGILWISTYGEGVYYYVNGRMYNMDVEDGLTDMEIYAMARNFENQIWVGTDAGISVCQIKDGKKHIDQLTIADGLSDEIVKTLLSDEEGAFWVGTFDQGVDFWNAKKQRFESLTPEWEHGEINSLEIFKEKEIWIGTEGNGLYRLNLKTKEIQSINLPEFTNSKVYDLHKDIEGNLWVLNNKVGISFANRQFERITHDLGNIQTVLTDQMNQVWLGTPNGLFLMENQSDGTKNYQPISLGKDINVISLYEDAFGNIWIGTFGQGLYCLAGGQTNNNFSKNKIKFFSQKDGLLNDNILSIDGTENMLWLATLGGVFELDLNEDIFLKRNQFRNFTHEDGLGSNFIYKAFVCSTNRTWFGTDGKGLSVLENGKITNYTQANEVPLKTIYTITEDHRGSIWFGTAEQGIFEFDGKNFHRLNVKEGFRDLEITSLVTDSLGNILIIHPSGIDILNPETKHLIYYDDEVGLEDLEPVLNSFSSDKYGNIWLGGKDKLVRYSALNEKLEIHPRNVIEGINVFFDPIDYQSVNQFSHTENNLVFNYVGLWFTNPEKVAYRYQLVGYNPEWIYSKDNQAHYSNLSPGNYTFKVSSTENGAFDGEPITSYSFEVIAPFWQQTWFIIFAVLFLLGLLYAWMKWKSQRLQREADLQKERIGSQLEVLKSQINPHFLFNSFNTLITLIEDEPEAATEYVEHLSDFYRSLLQYREKDLIPLQEELELLRNFSFLLKKRFGKNIQVEIPKINGKIAFIPPLTLQMLVENAVKHNVISRKKPLKISLKIMDDEIYIVNNLQKKITKEKSTHFGLQSIQARYDLLGEKQMRIEEAGEEFKVVIPVLNQ